MSEMIKEMIKHPIATILIMGTATGGIAEIINAVKGNKNN